METELGRKYKKDCGICGKFRLCHSIIDKNKKVHGYICKECRNKLMILTKSERKEFYDYAVKIGFIIPTEKTLKKTINALKANLARIRKLLDEYKAVILIQRNRITLLETKIEYLERLVSGKRTFKNLKKLK